MGKSTNTPRPTPLTYLTSVALVSAWLMCVGAPAIAGERFKLEVLSLDSTTAEEILPLITPFVTEGGTATGKGNQLIVKTTPENLAEIKTILEQLDTPPKQLRITVTQDIDQVRRRSEDSLSARVGADNAALEISQAGYSDRDAHISIRDNNGNVIAYRGARTRTTREDNNSHFVTTLEGRSAFIITGQATPYLSQSYAIGPYGAYGQSNTELVQTDRGFYVTPRVSGARVNLEISTRLDESPDRRSGIIRSRNVDTVLSGKLGEWIPVGGNNRQASTRQGEILAQTRGTDSHAYDVWVKVDLLP
ncbi:MAG: secretin N-terminal domain-containing protein [Gammaproteobacteria bacterium]